MHNVELSGRAGNGAVHFLMHRRPAAQFYVMHSSEHLLVGSKNDEISHEYEMVCLSGYGRSMLGLWHETRFSSEARL
jgi:hypothetical protein